jgi:hypothetical protein
MGFRTPLTSASEVDTGDSPEGPGVRMYQLPAGSDPYFSYPQGVAEWRDGTGSRHATITRSVAVYDDDGVPGGFVQVFGGSFTLDAGSYRGVDGGTLDFTVAETAEGPYVSTAKLRADVLDLGPVAKLRQTVASGLYPASAYGTIVFHTADVDTYGGFRIVAPATASSRWTCPANEGGVYAVEGVFQCASVSPANVIACRLLLNGAPILGSVGSIIPQAYTNSLTSTTHRQLVRLLPTDYIEFQGYVSGQQWQTRMTSADGVACTLTIERIA